MNIGLGIGIPFTRSSLWSSIFTPSALFLDGSTQGVWYDPSDINLTWRRNLLTYTEQFDNAVWVKSSSAVTANSITAPDGMMTADKLVESATTASHYLYQLGGSAGTYTGSVYVKAAERSWLILTINSTTTYFNILAGVTGSVGGGITAEITPVGGGWYRCAVTSALSASGPFVISIAVDNITPNYTGDGTSGIYIWGAQLEQGSTTTPYQRITDGIQDYLQYQAQPVLYRDAAGTQPVTAVEQPVGLMKDKSGGGNHAFNPSGNSANFPVLSARYNLLTKTEDFSDAVWSKNKTSVTANSLTAPNGTLTADTVTADGTSGIHSVTTLSGSSSVGSNKVLAVYAKAGTNNFIQLRVDFLANAYANFDLSSGVKGTTGAELASASIESAGNGWYRCSIVTNSSSDVAGIFNVVLVSSATSGNNESNTLSTSVYLWGADLRVANDALNQPAYQRVNTATDYDTVGFKPYVRFNGVNQWLQTNSIDFTYSDKMFVCAGVRKLSDAAIGILSELSAITDNNNGAFFLLAPSLDATASYRSRSKGTASVDLQIISGYPAPITNVFSFTGNISAPSTTIRVNGIQAATSTADQGTGNYGNYPLYIGARAGTSLFFNGRLYQLVIAAGSEIRVAEEDSDLFLSESGDFITAETTVAVIQSAIEQTEAFVNRKTSAF